MRILEVVQTEDLRAWFGKGKKGGAGGGGWDRYNSKGERIGKCGDRKKGEGKPKCLSKSKAAKLRAKGGKKEIAKASDPEAKRKELEEKMAKNQNPFPRAEAFSVHEIIDPRETRKYIALWAERIQSQLRVKLLQK